MAWWRKGKSVRGAREMQCLAGVCIGLVLAERGILGLVVRM